MIADQFTDPIAYHGEGPVWWPRWGAVRWVDLLAGDILTRYGDGRVERTPTGSPVVSVIRPRVGEGAIVATEREVRLAARDDLADLSDPACATSEWSLFDDPSIRTNEGGCDPQGRFYVGTMAYDRTPGAAVMYRVTAGSRDVDTVLTGLTISNGLSWSPDGSRAFYNDTPTGRTDVFDVVAGEFVGRRSFAEAVAGGHPDGLCLDAEGGVWVAMNGAGVVCRFDAAGQLTERVEVPGVTQPTACTFVGADLDTLVITTSRENLDDGEQPLAGALFVARPGVRGLPLPEFAG